MTYSNRLDNIILKILEYLHLRHGRPVTAAEVYRELRKRYPSYTRSERWIRERLNLLAQQNKVIKTGKGYIPLTKQARLDEFLKIGEQKTSGEITREYEFKQFEELQQILEEAVQPLAKDLAELATKSANITYEVANIASELATENPIDLFVDFILWLKDRFEYYAEAALSKDSSIKAKKERVRALARLRIIRALVEKLYGSTLGVPIEITGGKLTSKTFAAIRIRMKDNPHDRSELQFELNEQLLREILKRRIPDETVIVYEEGNHLNKGYALIIGQDTSVHELELSRDLKVPLNIPIVLPEFYVLAGIRYATWSDREGRIFQLENEEGTPYEIIPEPEDLSKMDRDEALRRGYVLTPDILNLVPEGMRRHTVEAQMNVLEYNMVLDSLKPHSMPFREERKVPPKPPEVLFFDGRLFPYEYKLDDAAYTWPHGEFVRAAMGLFYEVIQTVTVFWRDTIIVGVVKRSGSLQIAPIILWYMLKKGLINEDDFWRLLSINEQELVSLLLAALRREDKFVRTFIVIKRVWPADERLMSAFIRSAKSIDDEDREEFWNRELKLSTTSKTVKGVEKYFEEKGVDIWGAEIYSRVLASAAVASFYALPPGANILDNGLLIAVVPRLEVLLPLPYASSERWKERLELAREAAKRVLVRESPLLSYSFYELYDEVFTIPSVSGLIVPRHIELADRYAREFAHHIKGMYRTYMLASIIKWLKEKGGEIGEIATI